MQQIQKVTARALPVLEGLRRFQVAVARQNSEILNTIQRNMKEYENHEKERKVLEFYWTDRTGLTRSVDEALTKAINTIAEFVEVYKVSFRDLGRIVDAQDVFGGEDHEAGRKAVSVTLKDIQRFADAEAKTDPTDPEQFAYTLYLKTKHELIDDTFESLRPLDKNSSISKSIFTIDLSMGHLEFQNPKYQNIVYRVVNNSYKPEIQVYIKIGVESVMMVDRVFLDTILNRFFMFDATFEPIWDSTGKYMVALNVRKRLPISVAQTDVDVIGGQKQTVPKAGLLGYGNI